MRSSGVCKWHLAVWWYCGGKYLFKSLYFHVVHQRAALAQITCKVTLWLQRLQVQLDSIIRDVPPRKTCGRCSHYKSLKVHSAPRRWARILSKVLLPVLFSKMLKKEITEQKRKTMISHISNLHILARNRLLSSFQIPGSQGRQG